MRNSTAKSSGFSRDERLRLLELLTERERRARRRKLFTLYPDDGPLRRELYRKHLAFFAAGAEHDERLFLAANRVGKTEGAGGYEAALHLTGLYPDWWPGRRFERPTDGWAAGDTRETTKDIIQHALLGPPDAIGTGLIPGDSIHRTKPMQGVADAIATVYVRHVSGGLSRLGFKSYDQGRRSFQGTKKHFVWLDEEPPLDVYSEAMMRTASTVPGERGGLMLCTFTPLSGMSETVLHFLPGGILPDEVQP